MDFLVPLSRMGLHLVLALIQLIIAIFAKNIEAMILFSIFALAIYVSFGLYKFRKGIFRPSFDLDFVKSQLLKILSYQWLSLNNLVITNLPVWYLGALDAERAIIIFSSVRLFFSAYNQLLDAFAQSVLPFMTKGLEITSFTNLRIAHKIVGFTVLLVGNYFIGIEIFKLWMKIDINPIIWLVYSALILFQVYRGLISLKYLAFNDLSEYARFTSYSLVTAILLLLPLSLVLDVVETVVFGLLSFEIIFYLVWQRRKSIFL
jgi:hypothetical protein